MSRTRCAGRHAPAHARRRSTSGQSWRRLSLPIEREETLAVLSHGTSSLMPISSASSCLRGCLLIPKKTVNDRERERASLPAWVLLYTLSEAENPACRPGETYRDISSFRVRRIHPNADHGFTVMTPQRWADTLVQLRRDVVLSPPVRRASADAPADPWDTILAECAAVMQGGERCRAGGR